MEGGRGDDTVACTLEMNKAENMRIYIKYT